MSAPIQFTSGLVEGGNQNASSYILLPKTSTPRNIITKLDDLGLYSDMIRRVGESTTNFRSRLLRMQTLGGGAHQTGLTDAICTELGLGQQNLITARATLDAVKVEVTETAIAVTVSGILRRQVNLINPDQDGVWIPMSISGIVSGLQSISGVVFQAVSGYDQLPAFLIEPQSSLIPIYNEHVPRIQNYVLGLQARGDILPGPVLTDSVSFNDTTSYKTQVSGAPAVEGEWNVDTLGRVQVYSIPQDITLASYTFSLLGSGLTMGLVGNGARLFSLASSGVQRLLFTVSGTTEQARDFLYEIRTEDRNFWGE
jgi:hypothetical protein